MSWIQKSLQATFVSLALVSLCAVDGYSQGITITGGAHVVVDGSAHIVINDGGFSNAGVFNPGAGTVSFSGTASSATTTIGGSSTISFNNLRIFKSAGSARLLRNISVSGIVGMQAGNLDVAGFDLDLGSTGVINGESPTSFITGSAGGGVLRTVSLNAPNAVDAGNIGLEITSAANLGATVIKRGHAQQITGSGFSILRYYEIVPANNTNLNATLKFTYADAELAGINESELKLWSLNTDGNWSLLGADNQDVNANYVIKNGVNTFSRFTLASDISNPLPVTFVAFTGRVAGHAAILQWQTGSEINSRHFEIERSFDGRSFMRVGTVNSTGNAAGATYEYQDNNVFASHATAYYRLKEVGNDGRFIYSKVILLTTGAIADRFISAYPNPVSGSLRLRFTANGREKTMTMLVINQSGQTVASKIYNILPGLNDIMYDMSALAQGNYFIRFVGVDISPVHIIKK